MAEILTALEAFLQEHRRCGDLEGGSDETVVWMTCECGPAIAQPVVRVDSDP